MTDYFDSESNWQRLVTEVNSWIGTPFMEAVGSGSKKGVATDCVGFCERSLANVGAISPVKFPDKYVTFGGGKDMLEIFLEVMDGIEGLECVWDKEGYFGFMPAIARRGDLLLCSSGLALHHLCIFMGDNTVVHCLNNGRGVQQGNIHDPIIYKNVLRLYRARYADTTTDPVS